VSDLLVDTHALIWYLLDPTRLSPAADRALAEAAAAGDEVGFSAITIVETQYLIEKGRVPADTLSRIRSFMAGGTHRVRVKAVDVAVALSLGTIPRDQVPDMPDRIIAATALALDLPLVTRDHRIRTAQIRTIW
jgi:PIN domain nuclease of toxin-antitoxin system